MRMTINEVSSFVGGQLSLPMENIPFSGVSTDSRKLQAGNLFVPLSGERFDGHLFISAAEKNGASAALWNEDVPIPEGITIPLILVRDTLQALQDLAREYRARSTALVIGVTGSNGKTTTKDLIAAILAEKYQVHKTQGNLNNHIGAPLTILSMPETTEVLVIEMGMSNFLEIDLLSRIAKPDIAVITNIGESHLEYLKTRENIAKAKLEILNGMDSEGIVILPGDEELIRNAAGKLSKELRLIWVGKSAENDLFPLNIQQDASQGTLFTDNNQRQFQLPLIGSHNVLNSLMAIQVGDLLGVDYREIQKGLAGAKLTGMRLEKMFSKSGSLVLNDAYNASPTSMKAALQLLSELTSYPIKAAVLGDMLELGDHAEEYHLEIGRICAGLGLDYLICKGALGSLIAVGAKNAGMPEESILISDNEQEIAEFLLQTLQQEAVILIKGSRGAQLEKIVEKLN